MVTSQQSTGPRRPAAQCYLQKWPADSAVVTTGITVHNSLVLSLPASTRVYMGGRGLRYCRCILHRHRLQQSAVDARDKPDQFYVTLSLLILIIDIMQLKGFTVNVKG